MIKIFISGIVLIGNLLCINAQYEHSILKEDFKGVRCKGMAKYMLVPSDSNVVMVTAADEEIFDYIEAEVQGPFLIINITSKNANITKLFEKVTVKIFYKEIDHVIMDGGGSLESVGPIISKQLIANLRGTGRLEIEVECDYFEALMRGTSMFTVSGKTEHAIANVKGMGSIMAKDLIASNVNITVDGVGSSTVYASENLEATLNGVGSIKYLGNPKEKDFDVNGLGSIQPYEGD